jgi:radical SAM superfamily enzyme YgiQ (UPF0313 family)
MVYQSHEDTGTGRQRIALMRIPPFVGYKNHHPRDVTLPLTIGYIATAARQSGHDVLVLDLWAVEMTMAEALAQLRAFAPDVVFFEAHAPPFPIVQRCAAAVRRFSQARMVAFGSVPTFMPQRVVGRDLPIDVAVIGESEYTAADLIEAFGENRALADVLGIAFWDDRAGSVVRTPPRTPPDDLDTLPIIDYDLFDLTKYRKLSFPVPIHRQVRWGHILASRGCPYPCTHCSFDHRQSYGRKFRKHSPGRVVDEMELLVNTRGITAISIEDDIFTMDRQWVTEICDEILARGLKVKWIIQTRVDCFDRPLLRKMKQAGCSGISLGIESGNDRVLKVLKKGFTREQALEGIRMCQEEGLMMRLLFMIGNPTETAEEVEDTIDLVLKAKAITIQVHISTPYPGTGLLGEAESDGQHIEDFTSYNQIVHNISDIPDDVLWYFQKKFYRKYFFSWKYFKLFFRQRVWYMTGSWRYDVPLIFRSFWYLAWASRKQGERDVESTFEGADVEPFIQTERILASEPTVEVAQRDKAAAAAAGHVRVEEVGVAQRRKKAKQAARQATGLGGRS